MLEETLRSLFNANLENTEVIIIDQNEDQRMKVLTERLNMAPGGTLRYISAPGKGLSRGRNEGLRRASGAWLLFFDDDAIVAKDFFAQMRTDLESSVEKTMAWYGTVLTTEDKKNYLNRFFPTKKLHLFNFDSVCSIALLVNRKALEQVGNFDEAFGVGAEFGAGEESDLVLRLLHKHVPVRFNKNFIVYHPRAVVADTTKSHSYGKGIGALYRKHLFSSLSFFFVLSFRLLMEIGVRFILIARYAITGKSDRVAHHRNYLKGLQKGFRTFRNLSHFAHGSTNGAL